MIEILKNYDLTSLNTFGISAKANFFIELKNEQDLFELLKTPEFQNIERLFLGGGSNVLFTKDFNGIVILNRLKGIEIIKDAKNYVLVKSMGGEWWNDLVIFTVDRGYWGIENLSLVPGTVGATPVQNIGAYGVELKDVLENVEAYNIETGEKKVFTNSECEFGYRDSVFKNKLKGKYFISAIILRLEKNSPNFGQDKKIYPALEKHIKENNLEIKNSKDIASAVASVRRSKLPDPKVLGNAGSFFKNVFVEKNKLDELKKIYPDIPSFVEGESVKITAGWLIEACGWKGKRMGNVGVHDKQALVLVNHDGATGEEIKNLAYEIIDSVEKKFGLKLTPEVNFI
ncbi:MAG: UDP-N-acetylmuramate dehydrogenase [bacterium]